MRSASFIVLLLLAGSPLFAQVPKSIPDEWRATFEERPEMTEPGVFTVEKPQKALLVTGRFVPSEPLAETARNRQLHRERAELAAYSVLYSHFFERDKDNLIVPNRLKSLANDAVLKDAHRRTITVRGAKVLAVWADTKGTCCTLLISGDGIDFVKDYESAFRRSAGNQQLKAYEKDNKLASLRMAFECDPSSPEIRKEYSDYLTLHGYKVAGFLVANPSNRLPEPTDQLTKFLRNATDEQYKRAVDKFEQPDAKLETSLDGFLTTLDGQYSNPDCLNYIGVCFRSLGLPESARLFFSQAVVSGPHRFATTNLGLCLVDLDRKDEARRTLQEAVECFPDEPWTSHAKRMLQRLDEKEGNDEQSKFSLENLCVAQIARKPNEEESQVKDVEIESPFAEWLQAKPNLMSSTGVTLFKLGDGKFGLLVVAMVPLGDGSPKDILRAERVTKEKAFRSLVAKETGIKIASVQVFEQKTTVELSAGPPQTKTLAEYMEWTKVKVEGMGKELPVVGRWKSKDGSVFYLAVGVVCDKDGVPISSKQDE